MGDIVEHVARAIVTSPPKERREYTSEGIKIIRDYERTSRAAIRATLEYLRENVSDNVRGSVGKAISENTFQWNNDDDAYFGFHGDIEGSIVRAMLSAALNDIERTG